jgi:hypothetical protein
VQSLAPFFSPAYYAGKMPVFIGMQGHDLLDPDVSVERRPKTWLFWIGVALLVLLILAFPQFRRSL